MSQRVEVEIGKYVENPKYGSYHIIADGGFMNGKHMAIIQFDRENMFPGRTTEHMINGHTILRASLSNINAVYHNIIDPYQFYPFYLFGYGCRGFVDDNVSPLHKRISDIWRNRIAKISNPNHPQYSDYGGSGVTMWYEWRCFECFSRDVPSIPGYELWVNNQGEYDLDKDVRLGFIPKSQRKRMYAPDTCQFISHKINMAQAAFDRTYPDGLPTDKYIGVFEVDSGVYLTTFLGIVRGKFNNPIAAASYYNFFARYNNYPLHLMNNLDCQEMDLQTIRSHMLDSFVKINGNIRYRMIDSLY